LENVQDSTPAKARICPPVAQAFDLAGSSNTWGAPFFVYSAKGGSR